MRIGELAAQTGMTGDTIRFYEKVGLIAGRRLANGYRDFPPEAVAWLHSVRTAQTRGFSLAEIARTSEELRGAPDVAEALTALFEEKIHVVDARMAELATLRAELAARVGSGCPRCGQPVDPDEDGVASVTDSTADQGRRRGHRAPTHRAKGPAPVTSSVNTTTSRAHYVVA
jgi:MerR family transcriptional regulator, copper efflux regulator